MESVFRSSGMESAEWMWKGYRNLPRVIIGLGNPGLQGTPHNAGSDFIAYMCRVLAVKRRVKVPQLGRVSELTVRKWQSSMSSPEELGGHYKVADIALVQCTSGMNRCGRAVRKCLDRWSIRPSQLLCVHDSIYHDIGTFEFNSGGDARGHDGIISIIETINQSSFEHVHIGVRSSPEIMRNPKYLVTRIKEEEDENKIDLSFEAVFHTLNIIRV